MGGRQPRTSAGVDGGSRRHPTPVPWASLKLVLSLSLGGRARVRAVKTRRQPIARPHPRKSEERDLVPIIQSRGDHPRARQQVGEHDARLWMMSPRATSTVASLGISVARQRGTPIGSTTLAPLLLRASIERGVAEAAHPETNEFVGEVTKVRSAKLMQHHPAGRVKVVDDGVGLLDDGDIGGGAA